MFSAFKFTYTQTLATPAGSLQDSGQEFTGDTCHAGRWVVNANGGGANAITEAFPATGFKAAVLLANVPCVVTLTGVTVINGVTIGTVTLAANVEVLITAVTGDCTAISVGANTTGSGAAGLVNLSVLYDA